MWVILLVLALRGKCHWLERWRWWRGAVPKRLVSLIAVYPPPPLHPVTSLIKSCREACSIHRDSGWGCLLRRLFWGALHWMWILGCLLHGCSKFISSMLDWIYGSLRCFFCFFALPLLLVVLWLVSNKVEKVQKESTIGLFKVQHVLYIELDLPNWYSHSTKEGDPESHSCSSIVEPI